MMFQPQELSIRAYPVSLSEFKLTDTNNKTIIACPQPPLAAVEAGKAIYAPTGEFDVSVILEQLPHNFYPDMVSLSARNMSFIPRGLEKINCPKVMKIGDTFHWGDGSLSGIIRYCQELECDYHWVYQGVQHLHFFVEAGLKNVFWLPGTPVINQYIPEQKANKLYDVIFRGSQSELHSYRSYLLEKLRKSGINIDVQAKPYTDCLDDYVQSQIVFNCSLNGDTNRRVFEVLMAGGFLLTDRLSIQSGLFNLFKEGVHLECYGDEKELIKKINFYRENPDKAAEIAAAGHQKLIKFYNQEKIQQSLYKYIFQGELESPFKLEHDKRVTQINLSGDKVNYGVRLKTYELIQEIHRINPQIRLLYWKGKDKKLMSDISDLPRLQITYFNKEEDLKEMKSWCNLVGIEQQVHLSSDISADQQFQIVMVDVPQTYNEIKQIFAEIKSLVADSGLLIIVGNNSRKSKLLLNQFARFQGYIHMNLCFANFQQELGIDACLVYQKLQTNNKLRCIESKEKLLLNRLTFHRKIVRYIRPTSQIRQMRKLLNI